jgi:hypothetical protein
MTRGGTAPAPQGGHDGVYQLDEGAFLDALFYFLDGLGIIDLLGAVKGIAVQRQMVPSVQYILLYRLKTLLGIERMNALPALLFSDTPLMRLVGFNAHPVWQGVCQRGAAQRQGSRTMGHLGPDASSDNIVKLNGGDLKALFNSAIRALVTAWVVAANVTGNVDATDRATTAQCEGHGYVTRQRKVTDKRGQVREIEVTVYGWQLIVLIEARTKLPFAATVVAIQEHATRSLRALVTQARTNLAGHARLPKVAFDKGFGDGVDLWGLQQHGILFVVPAKENTAVTVDAQAQAAASEGITVGRWVQTVRHGQGQTAWTERR